MKTSGLRARLVKATALTTLFGTLAVPYALAQEETITLSSVVGTAPGNGNTYPQVYDALGRYVFFNATLDF